MVCMASVYFQGAMVELLFRVKVMVRVRVRDRTPMFAIAHLKSHVSSGH